MLSHSQRDSLTVVLVSPRNPLNIGAAARAMANFGFSQLAVVAPYEPHWREAKSAIGAEELLRSARKVDTLSEAVADCTLVLGTGSLQHRKPEQPVIALPLLASFLENKEKIAIVFGPEKRGLTREDLALCHLLVEIPTHPRQPSMNLAQAVAVCLYELSRTTTTGAPGPGSPATGLRRWGGDPSHSGTGEVTRPADPPATSRDLDLLADVIAQTMAASNYSPSIMRNANRHDLHLLLHRLVLTRSDARRILGVFRRVLSQLRRGSEPG